MNRFLKRTMPTLVLVAILTTLLLRTGMAEAAPLNGGTWRVVSSPNSVYPNNKLSGVTAVSLHNIWAVGASSGSRDRYHHTLIEHWDGSQWSVIPSPNPGTSSNSLLEVASASANDVWAVGGSSNKNNSFHTLIEHWNGARWSVVSGPNPGSNLNELFGVATVSASDVWAVGDFSNNITSDQTLIEHWDGSQWSVIPSPNPGTSSNSLLGVAAASASDIWAEGYYLDSNGVSRTFFEHWDGSQWSIVSGVSPGSFRNFLFGITAISTNNAWAVGFDDSGALIEHWDGSQWSVISNPALGVLGGVIAISASNIWAVGAIRVNYKGHTLIEHWDGSQWSVIPSPNPGSDNDLSAVAWVHHTGQVIAVGAYSNMHEQTLIEFYC